MVFLIAGAALIRTTAKFYLNRFSRCGCDSSISEKPATDTRAEFELVVIDPDELIARLSEAELCEVGAFKSRLNAIVDVYIKGI